MYKKSDFSNQKNQSEVLKAAEWFIIFVKLRQRYYCAHNCHFWRHKDIR